jgi:Ser/Thr protein kinase RdoA (MazF antagonist)
MRECKVKRVRLKRDSHTALYRVTATDSAGRERVVELAADILAPGAPGPDVTADDVPFGAEGWRAYIPELRLDLRVPLDEPALPALPLLTDPETARELLERAIRAGSPSYAGVRITAAHPRIVRAKGSRATVMYDLEFASGEQGGPTPVVVKTYRGDKGQNAYVGMQALWNSKVGAGAAVALAEPLAFVPEFNVLVQGPVHGDTTLKALIKSAFEAGTKEALLELSVYVDKTAVGLADLHTSRVSYGRTVTFGDKLDDVEETAERAAALAPALAGAAAPLLTMLEEQATAGSPDPAVPTHGSFRPNQVLLDTGEVGFIDFDRFGQAEPALDVASFRAALRDAGRLDFRVDEAGSREGERSARIGQLDALCDRFLDRYSAFAPVSRERVQLWEGLALFTGVLNCWTKLEAGLGPRLELLVEYLKASGLGG